MEAWGSTDEALAYGRSLLVGERLRLRGLREEDLPVLAGWYNAPEWAVVQSWSVRPVAEAEAIDTIRGWYSVTNSRGAGFSVELVDDGRLIGTTTLWGAKLPSRAATFAIMLGPEFASHGYGPEAARLMVSYGFRELGLNRIELRTWAFNNRAIRAYEKAGFVVEGRRRQVAFHDGEFRDEIIMAQLASEFFA